MFPGWRVFGQPGKAPNTTGLPHGCLPLPTVGNASHRLHAGRCGVQLPRPGAGLRLFRPGRNTGRITHFLQQHGRRFQNIATVNVITSSFLQVISVQSLYPLKIRGAVPVSFHVLLFLQCISDLFVEDAFVSAMLPQASHEHLIMRIGKGIRHIMRQFSQTVIISDAGQTLCSVLCVTLETAAIGME